MRHSAARLLLAVCLLSALPPNPLAAAPESDTPPTGGAAGLTLLEAIELTLEHDPTIALEEARREQAGGFYLQARGDFDAQVLADLTRSDDEVPLGGGESRQTVTETSNLSVRQPLRSGLSLEPGVQLSRSADAGEETVNQATLFLTLRQPLLRDRGRPVVAAGERAAERDLAAAEEDLRHTLAQRVLAVATRYWAVEAAVVNLEVLRASEASSRQLLATTRRLVAADVTPAAEIVQLEADLAFKESDRIGGERNLYQVLQELGREMGLEALRTASLPLPADPFPGVAEGELPPPEAESFIRLAMARRADLAAARRRLEGAEILERAAANALKPRLDLLFEPSYSGLVAGSGFGDAFSPLTTNVPGLSTSVGFSLAWPTRNRQARGGLIASQAARRQSSLAVDLLRIQIEAEVATALDAVRRSAQQVERAAAAVRLYEQAVANEDQKLRAGRSTLIDVISQRDRLTASRQRQVAAQRSLAVALAELRFATGTLLAAAGGDVAVLHRHLTTVPAFEEPP